MIYNKPDSPPHWSLFPRNRELYETREDYRRLFDEWDGKTRPWREVLAEQEAVKKCPHFTRVCGCEFGSCLVPYLAGPTTLKACTDCLKAQGKGPEVS